MASTTAFPSLSVPAPEDSMEMSSPGNRHYDDDIDIDFEDTYDGVQFTDDEKMLEDHEPNRPGTATDEMMQDDEQTAAAPLAEEVMEDDPVTEVPVQQDEDDELIDYDDEEFMDNQPVIDGTLQDIDGYAQESLDLFAENVDEAGGSVSQPADTTTVTTSAKVQVTADVSDDVVSEGEKSTERPYNESEVLGASAVLEEKEAEAPKADATTSEDVINESNTGTNAVDSVQKSEDAVAQKLTEPPKPLDTSATAHEDRSPTPTDTGLHPMIINWRGHSMPLFTSRVQPDGLLKDDNLVNVSLADLLSNCKEQITTTLDTNFRHDEELVLHFDALGLTLIEDSPSSFSKSLNDVLEPYLQLHQNDGTQDIPPLSLFLSVQPKFSGLLDFLKESAAQGSGLSIVEALHDSENDGEYYGENGDVGHNADAVGDDNVEHTETDEYNNVNTTNDVEGEVDYFQEGNEDDLGYHAEEHQDPDAEQQYQPHGTNAEDFSQEDLFDATDENERPDNSTEQYGQAEEDAEAYEGSDTEEQYAAADAGQNEGGDEQNAEEAGSVGPSADQPQPPGTVRTGSVEVSKDIRVDATNDSTEFHKKPDPENPSTAVAEENHHHGHEQDAKPAVEKTRPEETGASDSPHPAPGSQEAVLGSDGLFDDNLIDYSEDDLDDETQHTDIAVRTAANGAEAQDITHPTDNAGNKHHSDQQAGENEDDEQFHTAHDLLDGADAGDPTDLLAPDEDRIDFDQDFEDEDVINFDEDDDDTANSKPATHISSHDSLAPQSLTSKRSFNSLDEGSPATTEPEVKKARAV